MTFMNKNISKKWLVSLSFIICHLSLSVALTACSDANEYEDAFTDNPSWVEGYNDSLRLHIPRLWPAPLGCAAQV